MYTDVLIPSNGQQISCKTFVPSKDTDRHISVVFIHGFTSGDTRYIPLAEKLRNLGVTGLTVNLRGHNGSPYPLDGLSRNDHLNDIYAAYTYMRAAYPSNRTGILAKSYGACMSLLSTEKLQPDFLVIICPALYPDRDMDKPTLELIHKEPDIFRQVTGTPETNAALKAINTYKNPMVFITAGNDEEIPPGTIQVYKSHIPPQSTYVSIPGADHSFTKEPCTRLYHEAVITWLTNLPTTPVSPAAVG
jgi:esterase/lipase